MIVYAVYILTNSGLELISQKFHSEDSTPDTTLLAALMSAFQQMAESVTAIGIPKKICFEEQAYHWKSFGNIQVLVVTNSDEEPKDLLIDLGLQFFNTFKIDYPRWNGNQSMFEDFRNNIKELSIKYGTMDVTGKVKPSQILTAEAFWNIPKKFQPIASAVNIKSSSLSELLDEVDCPHDILLEGLEYLKNEGFVGSKFETGLELYFTLIGERS